MRVAPSPKSVETNLKNGEFGGDRVYLVCYAAEHLYTRREWLKKLGKFFFSPDGDTAKELFGKG